MQDSRTPPFQDLQASHDLGNLEAITEFNTRGPLRGRAREFKSGYYLLQDSLENSLQECLSALTDTERVFSLVIPKDQKVVIEYRPSLPPRSVQDREPVSEYLLLIDIEESGELIWQCEDSLSQLSSLAMTLKVRLRGEGAVLRAQGICQLGQSAQRECVIQVFHQASYTQSFVDYAAILSEHARVLFSAKAIIAPHLHGVEAHQHHKTLLRSPTAEVITRPELEIDSEDVKCSHGASVGQLDPEALFYLRSRGLSESIATELLEEAFLEPMRELFVKARGGL